MNTRDDKSNWKKGSASGNNFAKKEEGRGRSKESSRSPNYSMSRSRSRSYSKGRKDSRRRRSGSRSPSEERAQNLNIINKTEKGPALDFMIFLSKSIETALTGNNILKKIEEQVGGDTKLFFDYNFTIPELNGFVLHVKSEEMKKKREAAQNMLEFIVRNNFDEPEEEGKKQTDRISVLIMVPNGLISMIIGTKGRQISNLIKDSGANIVVNQPIYKMMHRTIAVSGKPVYVADAILMIQSIMEERFYEVSKVEVEFKPLNVTTTQTQVKLVIPEEAVECLNAKKGAFIDDLRDHYGVSVSFYQDRKNRQLDRREFVVSIKGTIECVQDAILLMIKKITHYIRATFEGRDSYSLKMLINKVYVTKLIGAGGCMIQEIASFAGGASIKILSRKMDEMRSSSHDIIVCIAGNVGAIQDASCIIIEQMECFKKGGPVLKSGRNLNQNIAQQFINSIFCRGGRKENEPEETYTLKDRFANTNSTKKQSSRSRSRSRSRHSRPRHSRSRSRTPSKDRKRKRHDDNIPKSSHDYHSHNPPSHHKNDNFDFDKDPSNNISYEESGVFKISNDIIVPDYLVSLLIGKNGETIRGIMNKSGSVINFRKEYNDDSKINTATGVLGRICNIKGTPQQAATAIHLLSEMIIKLETSLNGVRKEN